MLVSYGLESTPQSSSIIFRRQLCHQPTLVPALRVLRQLPVHHIRKLLRLVQRHLRAPHKQLRVHRVIPQLRDLANLPVPVHAKRAAAPPQLLLQPRRVQQHLGLLPLLLPLATEEAKRHAERRVQPAERHRLALRRRVHGQRAALHRRLRPAKVPQRRDGRQARGVEQVAVVHEHVQVHAHRPALLPGDQAQRLGVERAGAPDGLLEEPREEHLGLGGAVHLEGGRDHGAQLRGDGEDAVKRPVGERDRDFCGDFGQDSDGELVRKLGGLVGGYVRKHTLSCRIALQQCHTRRRM
ncbi:hypothetical protein ISF_08762 [Cordyceps fumosorosea ARSEF 2679]|uniref:Uncharacterized protein n=1 Tax=Cordyceps fumosorosea (strain ARSEF 2679) TaxID=1081104 RepID=A0A167LRJ7_CORFA|nr:hypothetical protein ISF_08762 [Cordyceps fumosorosea ARSEF 2679]OAA53409.1 hypothetical protein ISF_08762 [Cordyceps fumosorosea ARSEF 2679]